MNSRNRFAQPTFSIALTLAAWSAGPAMATDWIVDTTTGIQAVIDDPLVLNGDRLLVQPGTYYEAINFSGKAIQIIAAYGPCDTIIDASGSGKSAVRIVSAEGAGSVLEGFTIMGGMAQIGGGILCRASTPVIKNCVITANSCWAGGGGVGAKLNAVPRLENCIVFANSQAGSALATSGGAGVYARGASVELIQCTIADNTATGTLATGGGVRVLGATVTPVLDSCIVWGNWAQASPEVDIGGATVTYSDIGGWTGGTGNIDQDPLFANSFGGDFSLLLGSPCLNAGNPSLPVHCDGSQADMGAYIECGAWAFPPFTYCIAKVNSLGCLPAIGFCGAPSASRTSGFFVTGSNVQNNQSGFLVYSTIGPQAMAFQGGYLCVKGPIKSTPTVNSGGSTFGNDCTGVFSIDMNDFAHGGLGGSPAPQLLVPGFSIWCQWHGDDPGYAFPNDSTLTDGLEFTIGL